MSTASLPFPLLLILSGPSGAGKSTLCAALLASDSSFSLSVSCTTRGPRGEEVDGREYWFTSMEAFERGMEQGEFAEHAWVHGNRYGTRRAVIAEALGAGRSLVFDIDVQGAAQLRAAYPDSISVMVSPPSLGVLEARLRGRGTDAEPVVARRLAAARSELSAVRSFDYCVVNHDLEHAVASLRAIVLAERARTRRVLTGWQPG
jgi:guanylate kinase